MKFGLVLPSYGRLASRTSIVDAAVAAESLGYSSIWTTDHVIVPADFRQPYGNTFEVLTTLSFVAARTNSIQLGTSLVVAPLRNPIQLAKQCATIDALSSGRMILGVGAGYLRKEFEFLGADFRNRGERLEETIKVMRAIWKDGPTSYESGSFHLSEGFAYPKPLHGSIPIWIGGDSKAAMLRAARIGDGWHPGNFSPNSLSLRLNELEKVSNGRKITKSVRLTVDFKSVTSEIKAQDRSVYKLSGSIRDITVALEEYSKIGLDHLVCEFAEIEDSTDEDSHVYKSSFSRFARELMHSFN